MKRNKNSFELDLNEQLKDPDFASAYIMSAILDNDIGFLPVALGDVAKAHGISYLSEKTGIHRRTLYKVFAKNSNPSFELVTQITKALDLDFKITPKKSKKKKAS